MLGNAGNNTMDVRGPPGAVTKSLDGHQCPTYTILQSKSCAKEGEQEFMVTVGAADSDEPLFQITALKIYPDNIGDDWTVKAIILLKTFIIDLLV